MRSSILFGLVGTVWLGLLLAAGGCGETPGVGQEDGSIPADAGGMASDGGLSGDAGSGQRDGGSPADAGMTDAGGVPPDAGSPTDGGPAGVVINELYVDRNLSGDRVEFVELAGPVGTPLDGLMLRTVGPSGDKHTVVVSDTPGTVIGATGTWTVGGTLANGRIDQSYLLSEFGLDNTSGAVQLYWEGLSGPVLLDVVGYGNAISDPSTAPFPVKEGTRVALPPSGTPNVSIGRQGGVDTDDNASDFCAVASNAGAVNSPCQ